MSNLTLEAVENKLAEVIADPQGNYIMAGTNFSWSQYYNFLLNLRDSLVKQQSDAAAQTADISVMTFDDDVNEFGEDNSQRMK